MRFFKRTFHTSFLQSLFPIGQLVSEEKIEMWKVFKRQWMLSDGNISHDSASGEQKSWIYIVVVFSFIDGGNQITQRKLAICLK
jgi:hypothetical protein